MNRITTRARALFVIGLTIIVAACSAAPKTSTGSTPRKDPNVLDSTDFRDGRFQTLYDAIAGQRGDWLIPRGNVSNGGQAAQVGVFVGTSVRSLGVEYLQSIRPSSVASVKRLSPSDALHNYGWVGSALVVTLR
jgi:hypothetical protein